MAPTKRGAPRGAEGPPAKKAAATTGELPIPLDLQEYRARLQAQGKYRDCKPGSNRPDAGFKDPPSVPPPALVVKKCAPLPERDLDDCLVFSDFPAFRPNLTPKEVIALGSFGGTYFRDIVSAVTGTKYKGLEVIREFPADWFKGVDLGTRVTSQVYDKGVNRYGVACGASLGQWETSGWISELDPYGWFQWYCRFYLGRRSTDDARQVDRWLKGQGASGRWRLMLARKCAEACAKHDDARVSPVIRQTCQHWAYQLTASDLQAFKAAAAKKAGGAA